jgi:hypothetical protein
MIDFNKLLKRIRSGQDDVPSAHRANWGNPRQAPAFRLANPLTELADRHGSDKGTTAHLYTNHYHMLMAPLRQRTFNLIELGLQIGGPEVDQPAGRETDKLPSVRMWLDYFPKARIIGIDISDFSWFEHERFRFVPCDLDNLDEVRALAAELPKVQIIIDDASHASKHQQDAFLHLFPKLEPDGLYIIEDLEWQPVAYERKYPRFTTTAHMFNGFLESNRWVHGWPDYAEAFAAMSEQISGITMLPEFGIQKFRDKMVVIQKRGAT